MTPGVPVFPTTSVARVARIVGLCATIGIAAGCFEASGSGSGGIGGTSATSGVGGAGATGGAGGAGAGAGTSGAGAGAVGGTGSGGAGASGAGAGGTGSAGTGVGGTGTAGTSANVCDDCCAGRPNPQCAVVLCACPPIGGTSAGTGGVACDSAGCGGFDCCGDGTCVNLQNDVRNCGECGNVCAGDYPYCDAGTCGTPPCDPAILCAGGRCCGTQCCAEGELCCTIPGPIVITTACVPATEQGTCPMGCLQCDCNGPDTPIATPAGERPIASLREGDLVYSVEDEAIVVVPIAIAVRNPVSHHEVVRLGLEDGASLEVSARHPLVDGRRVGDLGAGSEVAGVGVRAAELVPYVHAFTYDILPASRTGAYFAGGLLLRSTLSP